MGEPQETVSLVKHFETRLDALQELVIARLEAINEAVRLAGLAVDKRLDGMNQIREQLKDQAATFVPKAECRGTHGGIDKDIRELRDYKAKIEGMASQRSVNLTMAIAIVSALVSIISLVARFTGK